MNSSQMEAQGWPREKILAALPRGAMTRIARRLGIHEAGVSHIVSRRARSRRIEAAIAQVLRVPREQIFGPNLKPGRKNGASSGAAQESRA